MVGEKEASLKALERTRHGSLKGSRNAAKPYRPCSVPQQHARLPGAAEVELLVGAGQFVMSIYFQQ
jgi:hypothetical protein